MTRQTLSGVRTRVKRLASRVPHPKRLTPDMLRRVSDEELDRLLRDALAAMSPDDPLRPQFEAAVANPFHRGLPQITAPIRRSR